VLHCIAVVELRAVVLVVFESYSLRTGSLWKQDCIYFKWLDWSKV